MSGQRSTCLAGVPNLPIVTRSGALAASVLWLACVLPTSPAAVGESQEPTTQSDAGPARAAKTDVDRKIGELIGRYETRIATLDQADAVVAANLPRLRENLALLRSELGRDKSRYPADCFTAQECIQWLERDMKFYLDDSLEKGADPRTRVAGRWLPKAYWIERADIMGRYDLLVPRAYDSTRSWPLVISYQDNPDQDLIRQTPYILLRAVQKGYPKSLVRLENKTRSMLKDVMRELNIDPYRIYATGFSFGGRTCLMFAWRYPHWFAAIAPVCNDLRGPETPRVRYLKNVPALLLHGDHDSFLATGRQVHAHMADADCPVIFQTYPGGHSPVPFRKDVKVLTDFFDRHVMNPYPKRVSHIVEHKRYSRAFWADAKLVEDAGGMEAAFEVRVGDANRVEIDTNEQIAELDLYLNARLVDMDKPVTVVSGDRVLYTGPAAEKLTVTLREAPDYARDSGDTLWQDLVRIHDQVHGPRGTQPVRGRRCQVGDGAAKRAGLTWLPGRGRLPRGSITGVTAMHLKYRIFNAPSAYTIDRAAELGCNWAIVHSAGIEGPMRNPATGREMDMFPLYFESYPKVARSRHDQDAAWIEPLRREVAALCERAAGHGLKVAFHMYEPVLPLVFEQEYPDIVGTWLRPTQAGTVTVHSCLDPDNAATWELLRSKYAELAREFPSVAMFILTTWDGSGTYWCIPEAEMPIAQRLTRMVEAVREGVQSERNDCRVCFRLWGRNWPRQMYLDGHRLIAEVTGVKNASELMERVASPHNDPDKVPPAVFAALPDDVPIMYKSTNIDIADAQPLTLAVGKYPHDREQIIEISYEQYHKKPWPWCKVQHIRRGLEAAQEHGLAGIVALPVNMGNNDRESNPDAGNLGRMNTWLLARLLEDDDRSDAELVAAWLMEQFGGPQPAEAVQALLEADDIVDQGIQWGGGVPCRTPFASLHTTKLYWMFDGFADPAFPFRMAKPDRTTLDGMIEAKHTAYERAEAAVARIKAARAAMHVDLYEELKAALTMLADSVLLRRDWDSYLLVQYGIERGVYPADRVSLGHMSRYVERFVANLARLRDTEAGRYALSRLPGPDPFPLT